VAITIYKKLDGVCFTATT